MQGIQPLLPKGSVRPQPVVKLGERFGAKTVDPALSVLANVDQTRLPQHAQMPRNARASYRKQRRQLTRRCGTANQGLKQRPAALVRQCS